MRDLNFINTYTKSEKEEKTRMAIFLNWESILKNRMMKEFYTFDKEADGTVSLSDFSLIFGNTFEAKFPKHVEDILEQ